MAAVRVARCFHLALWRRGSVLPGMSQPVACWGQKTQSQEQEEEEKEEKECLACHAALPSSPLMRLLRCHQGQV